MEEKLREFLGIAEALRSKRLTDSATAKKVADESEKIKSEADIARMVSSRATLEALAQPCCLPALQEPESLLCNIACTYMECEIDDELPSSSAFINCLMKVTKNSALPLKEALLDADELREGEEWFVDNSNCLSALLALADRQPRYLELVSRHDEPEPLPAAAVAAVTKATRDCEVWLHLFHSFFKPQPHKVDRELLDALNNSSLRLTSFYGHLDAAGIAQLPITVIYLGLAIDSAADSTAVSGLKPWKEFECLHVSVSSNVAAGDLSPLPSVKIDLHFPCLTDARVDSVRPAIEALVPDLKLDFLALPLSQLTAAGTRRLVQKLRGARIDEVTIELCGPWRPGKVGKELIEQELRSAVGRGAIDWNMDWLYRTCR